MAQVLSVPSPLPSQATRSLCRVTNQNGLPAAGCPLTLELQSAFLAGSICPCRRGAFSCFCTASLPVYVWRKVLQFWRLLSVCLKCLFTWGLSFVVSLTWIPIRKSLQFRVCRVLIWWTCGISFVWKLPESRGCLSF